MVREKIRYQPRQPVTLFRNLLTLNGFFDGEIILIRSFRHITQKTKDFIVCC